MDNTSTNNSTRSLRARRPIADTTPASAQTESKKKKATGKRTRSPAKEEPRKKTKAPAEAAASASKKKEKEKAISASSSSKKKGKAKTVKAPEQKGKKAAGKKEAQIVYQAVVTHDEEFGTRDEILGVYKHKADCVKKVKNHIEDTYGLELVHDYEISKDSRGNVTVFACGWEGESMTTFMRELKVQ